MGRLTGNATDMYKSYMWNVARNLNLNFVENLSTPGMVLWIWIGGVKNMHQNMPADHLVDPHWPS